MARTNKNRAPALAYLRTSSAANVGTDKDSEKRQRHAVQGFASALATASSMSSMTRRSPVRTRSRHGQASQAAKADRHLQQSLFRLCVHWVPKKGLRAVGREVVMPIKRDT